jgi:hypothetical protein
MGSDADPWLDWPSLQTCSGRRFGGSQANHDGMDSLTGLAERGESEGRVGHHRRHLAASRVRPVSKYS